MRLGVVVVVAAIVVAGCQAGGPTAADLARAQERVGVRPDLARCVAQAAVRRLTAGQRRLLIADPGDLPPGVSAIVTPLAAACAAATVGTH